MLGSLLCKLVVITFLWLLDSKFSWVFFLFESLIFWVESSDDFGLNVLNFSVEVRIREFKVWLKSSEHSGEGVRGLCKRCTRAGDFPLNLAAIVLMLCRSSWRAKRIQCSLATAVYTVYHESRLSAVLSIPLELFGKWAKLKFLAWLKPR